jgi:alkylated DNA repair dioxygenase AlkB
MTSPELEIRRSAPVQRIPLGDGSAWVDVAHNVLVDPEAVLHEVLDNTRWLRSEVWRYERYVEEKRLGAALTPDTTPTAIRQLGLHLDSRYRVRLDGPVAIWYRNGDDFQGLHSDRNLRWLDDTLIAILVLGTRRTFRLRPRGDWRNPVERGDASHDVDLLPGHGDLLVMGGRAQQDWLHGVPRADTSEPRVSITWRWTSRRGRPDTAPGYYAGRSFSDRPNLTGTRRRPA